MSEQADQRAKLLIALDFLRENHFGEQAEIFEKARVAKPLAWVDVIFERYLPHHMVIVRRIEASPMPFPLLFTVEERDSEWRYVWFFNTHASQSPYYRCDSLDDGKAQAEAHWQSLFESMSKRVAEC